MSNAAILKHFPGASNAGLRARIREALHRAPTVADAMNGIRYTVALSPSGAAKLSALESELRHNRAGGKRTAKRSSNRAGSINSRKISAAARAHVDDLVYSQGWSPADVASDPRPLESWEGPQILESAGLTRSASDEQYAAARRALAAEIRAYADKLSRSKANRAGTKRRATKKTANKAGKRRNRAGTPKRSARTGRFVSR